MNKFIFDTKVYYSLEEALDNAGYGLIIDRETATFYIAEFSFYVPASGESEPEQDFYNCTFKEDEDINKILNQIFLRYRDHYCIVAKDDSETEFSKGEQSFRLKLLQILNWTYPKYSTILKIYDDNKANLMNKLSSIDSETHSTSQSEQHNEIIGDERKMKINDTPQEEDISGGYEADGYVSELHKEKTDHTANGNSSISGSGSISRTHSSDPTTIMARIKEIEVSYSQVMKRWLDEFSGLFIEEGNV